MNDTASPTPPPAPPRGPAISDDRPGEVTGRLAPVRVPTPPPVPRRPRSWPRNLALLLAFLAVPAASIGSLAFLADTGQWDVPAASSTVPPGVFWQAPELPPNPLPVPDPAPQCLADALGKVPAQAGVLAGQVRGVGSDAVLWSMSDTVPHQPASNEKVLTTLALADALGPGALDATFTTSVVSAGDGIVLVGGGDPYLASSKKTAKLGQTATLADLAAATAQALLAAGRAKVALGYDISLFSGPSWNSTWPGSYVSEVTTVEALWADRGFIPAANGVQPYLPSKTPAADAAKLFARQLQADGVQVTSVAAKPAKAPSGAEVVASIESLPLRDIVRQTLLVSDNAAAEVLLRQLAVAKGRPGSFAEGTAAVIAWLDGIGLDLPGLRIVDGSGLSHSNAVPASVLAGAVAWAGASDGPGREVLTMLPVAAVSGSLLHRFSSPVAGGGRGWVHAKTGTLDYVSTLTGYTVTSQGQVLAFTFMVDASPQPAATRTAWLDQLAATLTTARC